jgi:hypothetical protein
MKTDLAASGCPAKKAKFLPPPRYERFHRKETPAHINNAKNDIEVA